jgi:hypothetical protein
MFVQKSVIFYWLHFKSRTYVILDLPDPMISSTQVIMSKVMQSRTACPISATHHRHSHPEKKNLVEP